MPEILSSKTDRRGGFIVSGLECLREGSCLESDWLQVVMFVFSLDDERAYDDG